MRDYKGKMNKYRLPKERYKALRYFCLCSNRSDRVLIETALTNTFRSVYDPRAEYIYLHAVSTDYTWARLEAEHIPCCRDTFNVHRARFYFELDKILTAFNIDPFTGTSAD